MGTWLSQLRCSEKVNGVMCSKGLPLLPWDPRWGNPFSVEKDGVTAERALRG